MDVAKIVSVNIGPYPRAMPVGAFDQMPEVIAAFDDGVVKSLFSFYPDELAFAAHEFRGLTEAEAQALRTRKIIQYLQI